VSKKRWIAPVAIVVALATAAVVGSAASGGKAAPGAPAALSKAAIVTDTAGLNDRSFNHLANMGRLRAQKQLKIQTRAFISTTSSQYLPNMVAAASTYRAGAVVANGFLLSDAVNTAATQFRNVKWAIVDFPWSALKDKPSNALGLTFRSEESGYLVGYLAAEMAKKQGGKQVVSAVGGQKIPSVDNWIAGFRAGAKKFNKNIEVLIDYSGQFPPSSAPKCRELAEKQIDEGSQMVFQVAGGCGLGALAAAKSAHKGKRPVWGIGVDANPAHPGKHTPTNCTKKVDVAVFRFFQQQKRGTLKTGRDLVFNLKNGGQGVGKISKLVPKSFITKMYKIKRQIVSGKIDPPDKLPS
jgi:basic membrane protein A and related proteins